MLNLSQIYYVNAMEKETTADPFAGAQRWLNSASAFGPADQSIILAQMRLFISKNKYEDALDLAAFDSAITNTKPMVGLWTGHALLKSGRTKDALDAWRQAGVSSDYLIGQGMASGDEVWFELALALDNTSHTYFLVGSAYEDLSRQQQSIEMYTQANKLNKGWQDELERYYAQYRMALHQYALRVDKYTQDQVQDTLLETIEQAKTSDRSTLPLLYLLLGTVSREMQDYALAETSFQELVQLSASAENYLQLAESVFLANEDPRPSLTYYAQAIMLSNYDPNILTKISSFALEHEETYGIEWLGQLSGMLPTPIDFLAIS